MHPAVRRSRGTVLAATATLGLLLAGCGSDGAGDGGPIKRVLIGAAISTSGPAAFAGVPVEQGIELAVKQANDEAALGEGVELDLEVVDVAADPAAAIAAYRQFDNDGAAGVLCCTLGSEAGALRPVMSQSLTPGVVTVSILEGLANPPHLFRPFEVPSNPGGIYDKFLDAVLSGSDFSTAVIVVNDDNDAMVQDSRVYADALERNGVRILDTVNAGTAETSFTSVATGIVANKPDVVVASTIGSSTAALARSLRERGYDRPIVSNVGADSAPAYEASAGQMEGTIFPTPYHADFPVNDAGGAFAEDYEAAYGSKPDMFAAHGYTAAQMLITAIADAESHDPDDVGAALSALTGMQSVYGELEFADGQAQVQDPARHLVWGAGGAITEWNPSAS
ncbi:MAG: ABC transporter substrate-binding protein [Nocardioides sp.]|nr:ABC transporter substrate-binding protein [Nocardioides sp.]